MAWLYQQKGRSKNWWIGYRVGGRQILRTTGTADEEEAKRQLARIRAMFEAHKAEQLNEELFQALTGKTLPAVSLRRALDDWLLECKHTTKPRTYERYGGLALQFKKALCATDKTPLLREVTSDQIRQFLSSKRAQVSASTVNTDRKVLTVFFVRCLNNGLIRSNPVAAVKLFAAGPNEVALRRRAFTLEEISLLHRKAPDNFWRYMILGGFYTGLRLGDLVCLRWGSVDFHEAMIRIMPNKTSRLAKRLQIPIAQPLGAFLLKLRGKSERKPSTHLWPTHATEYGRRGPGYFSNQFYDRCLTPAGLAPARDYRRPEANRPGRTGRRARSTISFHCLRHTFVTLLKVAGGNQAVARELAGHSSDLVSDLYTHLPAETLRGAIAALPGLRT